MSTQIIVGIDEVGRGPLAGPVVAAAVVLPAVFDLPGLGDSKKISAKKRAQLETAIIEQAIGYAVASVSALEIDHLNILQASLEAMRRAVSALSLKVDLALVDGNQDPKLGMPTRCIVGGDGSEACISAASIIAKEYRDRYMRALAQQFPSYGFETNMGYPTKIHLAALARFGVCPEHRQSFKPVTRVLNPS